MTLQFGAIFPVTPQIPQRTFHPVSDNVKPLLRAEAPFCYAFGIGNNLDAYDVVIRTHSKHDSGSGTITIGNVSAPALLIREQDRYVAYTGEHMVRKQIRDVEEAKEEMSQFHFESRRNLHKTFFLLMESKGYTDCNSALKAWKQYQHKQSAHG